MSPFGELARTGDRDALLLAFADASDALSEAGVLRSDNPKSANMRSVLRTPGVKQLR